MDKESYYVYILSSTRGTLYTGVTNDLLRRVEEHRIGSGSTFTKKYAIHRLIYFEEFQYVGDTIEMEKKIKSWSRKKKLELIRTLNPNFEDLSKDWFG